MVNATAFDIIAYGMTPLSMIAPFAGLTIVFSSLLAWTGLLTKREQLTPSGAAATAELLKSSAQEFGPSDKGGRQTPLIASLLAEPQDYGLRLKCSSSTSRGRGHGGDHLRCRAAAAAVAVRLAALRPCRRIVRLVHVLIGTLSHTTVVVLQHAK